MKTIALIPARYAASRFPGKLLQILGDKTVIAHTYLNVLNSGLFDEVAVVTDSNEIENEIKKYQGKVYRSTHEHECGTDRIAEMAIQLSEQDIVINIQGDEPFTQKTLLEDLIQFLKQNPTAQVVSLKYKLENESDALNPNIVKVVCDLSNRALLFSRSAIPYPRDKNQNFNYYKHIGIYAFRQQALQQFAQLPPSPLELIEKQEAMRFLENGIPVYMLETSVSTQGIDVPEDLEKAKQILSSLH